MRAVVLDEAGAMWKADALQVIGQTPVMAGDENQLPLTVMTLMDKGGSMLNQFAPDARTSILQHFKHSSGIFRLERAAAHRKWSIRPGPRRQRLHIRTKHGP